MGLKCGEFRDYVKRSIDGKVLSRQDQSTPVCLGVRLGVLCVPDLRAKYVVVIRVSCAVEGHVLLHLDVVVLHAFSHELFVRYLTSQVLVRDLHWCLHSFACYRYFWAVTLLEQGL